MMCEVWNRLSAKVSFLSSVPPLNWCAFTGGPSLMKQQWPWWLPNCQSRWGGPARALLVESGFSVAPHGKSGVRRIRCITLVILLAENLPKVSIKLSADFCVMCLTMCSGQECSMVPVSCHLVSHLCSRAWSCSWCSVCKAQPEVGRNIMRMSPGKSVCS